MPETFEGWADFFPRYTVLPWLKGEQHGECRPCANTCEWPSIEIPSASDRKHPVKPVSSLISSAIRRVSRLDRNCLFLPCRALAQELAANSPAGTPPKAKVDAHQLEAEVVYVECAVPAAK